MPRHTETEKRKNRFAGGTNRVQTADIGSQPLTRVGVSGDSKNLITNRAVQTGGAGDGVRRKRGRSATNFNQPTGGSAGTLRRFRESATKIGADDPSLSNVQALAKSRRDVIPVSAKDTLLKSTGGTKRQNKDVSGTSIGSEGTETTPDGRTIRSLKLVGTGKPKGAARQQDINITKKQSSGLNSAELFAEGLFGSASELVKLFSSKEFQQRRARGIQSAAGAKGRRADTKAKTDRIKALSGVLEDLSLSGGDNEGLMARIQEQIQGLISGEGGGASPEVVAKLADQFDNDQIKTILGIIR